MNINWYKKYILSKRLKRKIDIQNFRLNYLKLPSLMYWNQAINKLLYTLIELYKEMDTNISLELGIKYKDYYTIDDVNVLEKINTNKQLIINDLFEKEIIISQKDIITSIIYHDKSNTTNLMESPHYKSYHFLPDGNLCVTYDNNDKRYIRIYDINLIDLSYKTVKETIKVEELEEYKDLKQDFNNILNYYNQYNHIQHRKGILLDICNRLKG